MSRVLQWERELQRFLTEYRDRPFAWAENDCATFATEWIRRCTGQSIELPAYDDATGAGRLMAEGMTSLVTARLGEPMASPLRAMRGDIGLIPMDDRQGLGVVEGRHVASPGADGLVLVDRMALIAAWSI